MAGGSRSYRLSARARRFLLAALLCLAASPGLGAERNDLVGAPAGHITAYEDTLLDIARQYDIGYVEIRAANPHLDPWLPGAGKVVVLPTVHILPAAPRRGLVINLAELRMYYFPPQGPVRTFPLGIGGEGKQTPVGRTTIVRKQLHPIWIPTRSEREEDPELPALVAPGPDNPMGERALYLGWKGYAIHGTNKPYSIGRRDSHGCIRMYPEDVAVLFETVPVGTSVTVVDQRVKLGWSGSELFLEVHPSQGDADAIEAEGRSGRAGSEEVDALVAAAAGAESRRIDWYQVHLAAAQRSGLVVRITRPPLL